MQYRFAVRSCVPVIRCGGGGSVCVELGSQVNSDCLISLFCRRSTADGFNSIPNPTLKRVATL